MYPTKWGCILSEAICKLQSDYCGKHPIFGIWRQRPGTTISEGRSAGSVSYGE